MTTQIDRFRQEMRWQPYVAIAAILAAVAAVAGILGAHLSLVGSGAAGPYLKNADA